MDVAVVGASIAGCIAAKHAAQAGLDVVILEEHGEVGKQRKCTSIVSASGLPRMGIDYQSAIVHQVQGAFIHSPAATLTIRSRETKAYVLDRQRFDEQCAMEAEQAGAAILLNEPALSIRPTQIQTSKRNVTTRAIVGADGASSQVARSLGFAELTGQQYVLCYEAEFEGAQVSDPSMVDVFVDNEKFPGFFAWMVPTSAESVRVGLGTVPHASLEGGRQALFENRIVREALTSAKSVREFHALIPLAFRSQTQLGTTLLVGDAAGQVKATTGGGWVYGGSCARLAGDALGKHVGQGQPLVYEQAWRSQFEGPLRWHQRIRGFLNSMSNRQLDWLVGSAAALRMNRVMEWFGDMDFILKQ